MEEVSCALQVRASGPYPPLQVARRDRQIGQAMLSNVGGGVSEMGAVALYLYGRTMQSHLTEVAEVLSGIARVEMHHLDIFMTLSRQLGEDPRLWTPFRGGRRYWTPECLRYPRRLEELLRYALSEEQAAIQKYTQQATWIRDEGVVAVLRRIIEDERVHVGLLTGLLASHWESSLQERDLGLQSRATR